MWGRVVEIMTGVWLMLSPFIFGASDNMVILWGDIAAAALLWLLAGASYWRPTRYAHLAILLVAIGLAAWGRLSGSPPEPAHQNHIAVALFLLMIAIIPNDASKPPLVWREAAE